MRDNATNLLRNAAIALSVIPLLENIDASLDQEWNQETFEKTDAAMNRFVEDLEGLGFAIIPLTDAQTAYDRSGEKLAEVQRRLGLDQPVH